MHYILSVMSMEWVIGAAIVVAALYMVRMQVFMAFASTMVGQWPEGLA